MQEKYILYEKLSELFQEITGAISLQLLTILCALDLSLNFRSIAATYNRMKCID